MRVFVTGSSGFVGRYLVEELKQHGHEPIGWDTATHPASADLCFYQGDITNAAAVHAALSESSPEACIHLAGIAFVPMAWKNPQQVMRVNINGSLILLEAVREVCPSARVLTVSSAEIYGRHSRGKPLSETDAPAPSNLYGVSKMAADLSTLLYHRQYGMHTMTARPQNHIGPRQSRQFVVSSFAEQLVRLKADGGKGELRVGNLESRRDFTDVRDVARAYRLLIENGQAGEAYHIASGRLVSIGHMLDALCAHAGIHPKRVIDPERFRPTDEPVLLSIDKIAEHVGWNAAIPLERTLKDIYDDVIAQPQ